MPADLAGQASVIDGDTLEMHGTRIRLWGIDAPESDQLCRGEDSLPWRLGGRILSADKASEDSFDLGPSSFLPGTQPGMAALIDELGLAARQWVGPRRSPLRWLFSLATIPASCWATKSLSMLD
jgi:hypothetical protein